MMVCQWSLSVLFGIEILCLLNPLVLAHVRVGQLLKAQHQNSPRTIEHWILGSPLLAPVRQRRPNGPTEFIPEHMRPVDFFANCYRWPEPCGQPSWVLRLADCRVETAYAVSVFIPSLSVADTEMAGIVKCMQKVVEAMPLEIRKEDGTYLFIPPAKGSPDEGISSMPYIVTYDSSNGYGTINVVKEC